VPYLGGAAVAAGLAAGLAVEGWGLPLGVSVALFGAWAVGLVDDAVGLAPPVRLGAQTGLAVAMVAGGLYASALPTRAFAYVGAVLFFVAAVNAVNMVDGMDGLAGGIGLLSALGLAAVAAVADHAGVVELIVAGAVLGFLVHNLPPARLFLGDNGAYLLGAALVVGVLATGRTVPALAGAATCLGFFLLDFVLAVLRRATGRVALFAGDRGHLYDQLRMRGLPTWRILGVSYGIHAVLVGAGVLAASLPTGLALVVAFSVWGLAVALLIAGGFVSARMPKR
jgi:UDP-GlcNAc:undecaprenyl-phosphate GlcNAc-1-phosphate transferase